MHSPIKIGSFILKRPLVRMLSQGGATVDLERFPKEVAARRVMRWGNIDSLDGNTWSRGGAGR
jgi:hypothetical protein